MELSNDTTPAVIKLQTSYMYWPISRPTPQQAYVVGDYMWAKSPSSIQPTRGLHQPHQTSNTMADKCVSISHTASSAFRFAKEPCPVYLRTKHQQRGRIHTLSTSINLGQLQSTYLSWLNNLFFSFQTTQDIQVHIYFNYLTIFHTVWCQIPITNCNTPAKNVKVDDWNLIPASHL